MITATKIDGSDNENKNAEDDMSEEIGRELTAARDARRLSRMARHASIDRLSALLADEHLADLFIAE